MNESRTSRSSNQSLRSIEEIRKELEVKRKKNKLYFEEIKRKEQQKSIQEIEDKKRIMQIYSSIKPKKELSKIQRFDEYEN